MQPARTANLPANRKGPAAGPFPDACFCV